GHVDHGKTTLLDFIRKTRVAAKEAGGITQHLGAYKITTPHGKMAFLDTPGHEAFSAIRARGLAIADVVILVVAGDDGLKPQTIEAINYIKQVKATVVVAVNKMDKVAPERLENIRTQLAQYDLLAEEWGGDVVVLPISAKTGLGVDKLLEMVALQAELLELKADPDLPSSGYILEAHIKKGRGSVGTYIAQHGTLKVGDYFTCGTTRGCVTALIDEHGRNLKLVGPAEPVVVAGFEAIPRAGDYFEVGSATVYKQAGIKVNVSATPVPVGAQLGGPAPANLINLIIKADTDSAREALCDAIDKLNKGKEPVVKLVAASVGNISEKDVTLAHTVGAVIYSFNSKVDPQARALAQQQQVTIANYAIIYRLIDDLQALIDSKKVVEVKKERIGTLIIRKVFNVKGVGVVAGFGVRDGFITNQSELKVLRGRAYLAEGGLKSLQSDKQTVAKITTNYEGALMMKNFNDWLVDDIVEVYAIK
ncbi:MAG TPA: translation initiation factor IF-2, partial [Candidatus Babeliales bacterium]|nr:translation initiation factor IF-2 [Candidatus Babeliales bacterium]